MESVGTMTFDVIVTRSAKMKEEGEFERENWKLGEKRNPPTAVNT